MAASKTKPIAEQPAPHAWPSQPDAAAVEEHVRSFFAAIRANTPAIAFALCPHAESSFPFIKAPDKKSIAAAFKLLCRVLTDNTVASLEDEAWYERIDVDAVRIDAGNNVYATITYANQPTPLTGLFKLAALDGRWQLGFSMLRVLKS